MSALFGKIKSDNEKSVGDKCKEGNKFMRVTIISTPKMHICKGCYAHGKKYLKIKYASGQPATWRSLLNQHMCPRSGWEEAKKAAQFTADYILHIAKRRELYG